MTMPARAISLVPQMATPRRAYGLAGQTWHILRFDVLRLRWWLSITLGLLLIGSLQALEVLHLSDVQALIVALGVPLSLMVCAVVLVQGDHPTATDAFWRGKPTNPWAQVIAKLLILLGMTMVALVVLAMTLGATGVPGATVATLVRASMLGMVMWPLLALTIGAVTRDLRSAPLLFVVIAMLAIGLKASERFADVSVTGLWMIETWVVVIGGIALVTALYHGAMNARVAIVTTVLLGVTAIDAMTREVTEPRGLDAVDSAAMGALPADPTTEQLVIDSVRFAQREAGAVWYHVANARPDARYAVQGAQLMLHYANGDSVPLALMDGGVIEAPRGATPLPVTVRWGAREGDTVRAQGKMTLLVLTRWGDTKPPSTARAVSVRGTLRRMAVHDTMSAPWQPGDVLRRGGQRLQLLDSIVANSQWLLRATEPRGMAELERDAFRYSAASLLSTTVVRIDRNQLAYPVSTNHVVWSSRKVPIVLPWVVRTAETIGLNVDPEAEANSRAVDVAGARLHVVRWETAAAMRVHAEFRLSATTADTPARLQ